MHYIKHCASVLVNPCHFLSYANNIFEIKIVLRFYCHLFIGIPKKNAEWMPPPSGMVMEATYEAILDAGLNLSTFHGKKVAICGAISCYESHEIFYKEANTKKSYCVVE